MYGVHAIDGASLARIEDAAAQYAAAIANAAPEGPIHLVGWSYGGLVAYETALRLREAGRDVGSLVLIDAPAPHEERHEGHDGDGGDTVDGVNLGDIDGLGDLGSEDATAWAEGVTARIEAAKLYRPRPYQGDVVVVRGTESVAGRSRDATLGWRHFVKGNLTLEWAAGSHESMMDGDGARSIAAIVEHHAQHTPDRHHVQGARGRGESTSQ